MHYGTSTKPRKNKIGAMYLNNVWMLCYTDQNTTAFKEVAIIRHPRVGEYAFGFITSTVLLQVVIFIE